MLKNKALVSVIIVTRDRQHLLDRAIESVLAQSYTDLEIILIDNLSNSPPNLDKYSDSSIPIKVFRNEAYLSAAKSRNVGISHASGDFICFLDDDDYSFPNKMQLLINAFLSNPSIAIAFGNTKMLGVDEQLLGICTGTNNIIGLMRYRGVHLNAVMIKNSVLINNGFNEEMTTFEDVELMFRLVSANDCAHVDEVLAVWNRDNRSDQLTNKNYKRSEKNWLILCEQFFDDIKSNQSLARFYFKKMFLLSMINLKVMNTFKYLFRFIYFGFVRF